MKPQMASCKINELTRFVILPFLNRMRLEMMTDKIQYGQGNKDAPIVLQRPPPSEPMGGVQRLTKATI